MRVVSLLPSATEIICGLGLRDALVGVSHECDYPAGVECLPKVTRTRIPQDATSGAIDASVREQLQTDAALYALDRSMLESLQPDLIVTQALCDVCAVAEDEVQSVARSLASRPQIINLEPSSLTDVFECVQRVGAATGHPEQASASVQRLRQRVDAVARRSATVDRRPRVVVLEWIDPPFAAGHWTPELVELAGGREAIGEAGERSETITWERIVEAAPEVMLIACCGFDAPRALNDVPLLRARPDWNSLPCVKTGRVHLVDGSAYFSRPGPRLVDSLEILAHTLHPELHPLPAGLPAAFEVSAPRRAAP